MLLNSEPGTWSSTCLPLPHFIYVHTPPPPPFMVYYWTVWEYKEEGKVLFGSRPKEGRGKRAYRSREWSGHRTEQHREIFILTESESLSLSISESPWGIDLDPRIPATLARFAFAGEASLVSRENSKVGRIASWNSFNMGMVSFTIFVCVLMMFLRQTITFLSFFCRERW